MKSNKRKKANKKSKPIKPRRKVNPVRKNNPHNLSPKMRLFCELFVSEDFFGNGVQAYIQAYNPDRDKPNWYNTARSIASENLTKPSILAYITELIDLSGVNDSNIDKQLLIVLQQNADYSSKVAAIREYNKLKKRIEEKIEHNTTINVDTIDYSKLDNETLRKIAKARIKPDKGGQSSGK